jgi:hypothetical protein
VSGGAADTSRARRVPRGTSLLGAEEQYDSELIEAALANGAVDGSWHADRWGVAFEICFEDEERWEAFRSLPAVRAALDSVPDPVNGLLVYRGRGGGAGAREPRQPQPAPAASAVSLPEPQGALAADLTGISPPDPVPAALRLQARLRPLASHRPPAGRLLSR